MKLWLARNATASTPQHETFRSTDSQAQAWRDGVAGLASPKPRFRGNDLNVEYGVFSVEAAGKVSSPENCEQVAAWPRRKASDFRAFPSSRFAA